jgi:hypothetical protein
VNTPTLMKTLLPCMPELSVVGREVTSVMLQYYPYDYLLGMTFENERGAVLSFVNRETVSGDALPSTFTLAADCTMAVPEVVWAVETHGYRSVLWRFSAEVVDLQSGLSVAFDARSSALRVGHASVGTAVPLLAVAERDVRYDTASQQQDAQCAVACAVMAGDCDRMAGWQALTVACVAAKGGRAAAQPELATCDAASGTVASGALLGFLEGGANGSEPQLVFGCDGAGRAVVYGAAPGGAFVALPLRAVGFDARCSACVPLVSTVTYPSPVGTALIAAVLNFVLVMAAQYVVPRWVRDQLIRVPVFVASPLLGFLGVRWRREDLLRHARNVRECTFVSLAERERLLQRHVATVQACVLLAVSGAGSSGARPSRRCTGGSWRRRERRWRRRSWWRAGRGSTSRCCCGCGSCSRHAARRRRKPATRRTMRRRRCAWRRRRRWVRMGHSDDDAGTQLLTHRSVSGCDKQGLLAAGGVRAGDGIGGVVVRRDGRCARVGSVVRSPASSLTVPPAAPAAAWQRLQCGGGGFGWIRRRR